MWFLFFPSSDPKSHYWCGGAPYSRGHRPSLGVPLQKEADYLISY